LAQNKQFRYLGISDNNIGDEGFIALANLPDLKWFYANNTQISDISAITIALHTNQIDEVAAQK